MALGRQGLWKTLTMNAIVTDNIFILLVLQILAFVSD